MNIETHIAALLEIGRSGSLEAASKLPSAGIHSQVVLASSRFRGSVVDTVARLSVNDRIALAKAMAVYEDSVGGIGSVTAVQQVMRLFGDAVDQGYATFRWIAENTRSLRYYTGRAVDFIEPEVAAVQRAEARADVERRNYELAAPARARRAERATGNLYNAVRRGDINAVQALLYTGADPACSTPTGEALISYARSLRREGIASLLEAARDARNAA